MHQKQWEPSEQIIEGEFWRIVEKPTEEIEVFKMLCHIMLKFSSIPNIFDSNYSALSFFLFQMLYGTDSIS